MILFGIDLVKFGVDFINFYALYLAISVSLNLEFGYTGIPNFGKVLFIAGGAAFAGSVSGRLAAYVFGINPQGDFITFNAQIITSADNHILCGQSSCVGIPLGVGGDPVFVVEMVLLSLLIAALVGAGLGYLTSYPAIRLREDYLGMLLLGSAQFFQVVLRTYQPLIGGTQPIFVPDPYYYWAQVGPGLRDVVAAAVVGVFALLVYIFAERLVRSPLGRSLRAIRDNEDAAKALGKNDVVVRRKILMIAAAIAGMAGALYTFYTASVEYDTWTRFAWTFWPFLIVIIGGAGNNVGAAVGTFFFTLILKGLELVKPALAPYLFFDVNWLQDFLFFGLLIAILLIRPEGVVREKPTSTISNQKIMGILRSRIPHATEPQPESKPRDRSRLSSLLRRKRQPAADG